MRALEGRMEKRLLLDMLAYLLWNKDTLYELSPHHLRFGKKLYAEVLNELKEEAELDSINVRAFGLMNMECEEVGKIYFQEKRLEAIEQLLEKRFAEII